MMWALCAAGVGLLLVELSVGMEYLEAGFQQNMGNILGWVPAMGMIMLKVAEQAIWYWGTLSLVLRILPFCALGLLLVVLGLALNKPVVNAQDQDSDK